MDFDLKNKMMKRQYIQPNLEISYINLKGSILADPTLVVGNGSNTIYGTSMDSNQGGFDEEEDDNLKSNDLWDDSKDNLWE